MKWLLTFFFIVWLLLCNSCHKNTPAVAPSFTPYEIQIPKRFPLMEIPADNTMSTERLFLGRKLYYDTILSNTGKACASCHFQEQGFTSDAGLGTTVLPHINLGWNTNFLWRGEEQCTLEEMMMFEVTEFFHTNVSKLNANSGYRNEFFKAYGVKEITSKEIAYALAQFFRVLNSGNSKFDKYRRGELPLSPAERNGMHIFFTEKGDCFHCHNETFFSDNLFHNTGLDSVFLADNKGRFHITGKDADIGKYKTPTLRNCGVRNRFMHDGRFTSLQQVIEFYNSGVHVNAENIDPLMVLPHKMNGLQLSQQEKNDLLSFLYTLTDTSFLTDPNLAKP